MVEAAISRQRVHRPYRLTSAHYLYQFARPNPNKPWRFFLSLHPAMAHYNIFREQLAIRYPEFGHALWEPSPRRPDRPVEVGDVGFIRRGKFHRLFNALLPADDPSQELGVPEYHEQLIPNLPNHIDHIDRSSLSRNYYCSAGVSIEPEADFHASG